MADNYLERRFEEHEKQSAAPRRRTITHKQRRLFFAGAMNEIGFAVVRSMCALGHKVAFCSTDEASAHDLASHTGAVHINIDIHNAKALESAIDEFVDKYGNIDIVVYNGTSSSNDDIESANISTMAERVAVEMRTMLIPIQKMVQNRNANGTDVYGRVVCINSNSTDIYSAAINGATTAMVQKLADELRRFGISTNSITAQENSTAEEVARLCRILIDDVNGFINGKHL